VAFLASGRRVHYGAMLTVTAVDRDHADHGLQGRRDGRPGGGESSGRATPSLRSATSVRRTSSTSTSSVS
jgi:hypothetical protein